ncbi:GNAT family N-acetyltransferase, partial [Streptococcus thermophilus]
MICLEKIEDIPRLQELFAQILIVHHQARSDVLKVKGSKFTDKELEGVIGDAN